MKMDTDPSLASSHSGVLYAHSWPKADHRAISPASTSEPRADIVEVTQVTLAKGPFQEIVFAPPSFLRVTSVNHLVH
jgi:hypothetical protein